MAKGVGTTVSVIITVIILLTFFGIYMYVANAQVDNNIKLNLETLQLLKLKSTFETFNQSLGMTWFISTVQTVFHAGDKGIGCGYDGPIDRGFWLQDKGVSTRNFTSADLAAMTDKYNGFSTPSVCYPKDRDIENYIRGDMSTGGYLNIPGSVKADGVEITRGEPSYPITIDNDGVKSVFTQKIVASDGKGKIEATTENANFVKTKIKEMTESGRGAVARLVGLGDLHSNFGRELVFFRPFGDTASAVAYTNKIKEEVVASVQLSTGSNIKSDVIIRDVSLYVDDGAKIAPGGSGLMVKYLATVKYSEAPTGAIPPGAVYPIPTDSTIISSCYGYREDPINDAGKFHGGIDIAPQAQGVPVYALDIGTVVEAYSTCIEGDTACGAPSFARYGNMVMIQHANFYSFYAHLASVDVQVGQQVSAGEQIGTMGNTGRSDGVHLHFEVRLDGTSDTREDPCGYVDCSVSTGEICSAISSSNRYYYYDEDAETFSKRPMTMQFNVQDSLPALSCTWWSAYWISQLNVSVATLFNYQGTSDMMCCNSYIFSCGVDIPNMPADQKLQPGEMTSDSKVPQKLCNMILRGNTIACGPNGFITPPNT